MTLAANWSLGILANYLNKSIFKKCLNFLYFFKCTGNTSRFNEKKRFTLFEHYKSNTLEIETFFVKYPS